MENDSYINLNSIIQHLAIYSFYFFIYLVICWVEYNIQLVA